MRDWLSLAVLVALAAGLASSDAAAQAARPPAAPAAPPAPAVAAPAAPPAPAAAAPAGQPGNVLAPDRTTAQYGDWTLVCAGPVDDRRCEVAFVAQDRQSQTSAALAIGRNGRDAPFHLVLRVPISVAVAVPARLVLEGGEPVALPFRICNLAGCFAGPPQLEDSLLARLRSRGTEQPGRAEWRDATANLVGFTISFRGLTSALEALARELR